MFVGIDQDPTAHALAQPRCAAAAPPGCALHFAHRNFREWGAALADAQLQPASVDGALFDLGMSSMQARQRSACSEPGAAAHRCTRQTCTCAYGIAASQVDTAERGFSFLREGPIDMRMDPGAAVSAEDILNTWRER